MADDMSVAECPTQLLDNIFGFHKSQVIFTAVKSGLFDGIEAADGRRSTAEDLSSRLGLDTNCTSRMLRVCVCLGLLMVDDGETFSNTEETSRYLVTSSPLSIVPFVRVQMSRYRSFDEKISEIVSHGQQAIVPNSIARAGQISDANIEYNNCMLRLAAHKLVTTFDLSIYSTACDMAGGVGELARALKKTYPTMDVSVLEQPGVVDYAHQKGYHQLGGLPIHFIKGDMMASDLPAVELFVVSHVVMLYSDDQLKQLYRRINLTLPQNGALMLCESILNPQKCGPMLTLHRDIMDMEGSHGGERTAAEHKDLLVHAGFLNIKIHVFQDWIGYDIILATKT